MAGPSTLRERREIFRKEIETLGAVLVVYYKFEKNSQLRIVKLAVMFFRKERKFASFNNRIAYAANQTTTPFLDNFLTIDYLDQILNGFIICFDAKKTCSSKRQSASVSGELVYISENVKNYFEWNSIDIMLTYDSIYEITSAGDAEYFDKLCASPLEYTSENRLTSYVNCLASRIKRDRTNTPESDYRQFKATSHYDPSIDAFVAVFQPVLNAANRDQVAEHDPNCFRTVHDKNLALIEPIRGPYAHLIAIITSLYEIISPESLGDVAKRHREILEKRSSRGSTDLIKILLNDGSSIYCLFNMYVDPTSGSIVCVYQKMSDEEAHLFKERRARSMERSELQQQRQQHRLMQQQQQQQYSQQMNNSDYSMPNSMASATAASAFAWDNNESPLLSPESVFTDACLLVGNGTSNNNAAISTPIFYVDGSNEPRQHGQQQHQQQQQLQQQPYHLAPVANCLVANTTTAAAAAAVSGCKRSFAVVDDFGVDEQRGAGDSNCRASYHQCVGVDNKRARFVDGNDDDNAASSSSTTSTVALFSSSLDSNSSSFYSYHYEARDLENIEIIKAMLKQECHDFTSSTISSTAAAESDTLSGLQQSECEFDCDLSSFSLDFDETISLIQN